MRDKYTRNEKGQLHGLFQDYHSDGRPWETSHYVNDVAYGYSEIHSWIVGEKTTKIYYCR